jgi:hypothetical protein
MLTLHYQPRITQLKRMDPSVKRKLFPYDLRFAPSVAKNTLMIDGKNENGMCNY